jgi:archaellum biogenesis ATPase FlaH
MASIFTIYGNTDWWVENIIMEHKGTIGIVSYFKEDIENQIKVLDKVWPNKKIKNKFVVVKSLNSIAGNEPDEFNDWLEVFNDLQKRVKKEKEPTLWLVSAGCYGLASM